MGIVFLGSRAGERRAAALATVLAQSPDVLLLDEPTEGLAPLIVSMLEEQILKRLPRLRAGDLVAMVRSGVLETAPDGEHRLYRVRRR